MNSDQKAPHVSIIILNWNGWQDSIECLESVFKLAYPTYHIILIDNGSTNDSVKQISQWLSGHSTFDLKSSFDRLVTPPEQKPVKTETFFLSAKPTTQLKTECKVLFAKSEENLGFAVANNIGIEFAKTYFKSKYYFLLNNDTVVEKNTLFDLVQTLEENQYISAVQSTIHDYQQPHVIANAGGSILPWAQTRYYKKIRQNELKVITFINGCALLLRSQLVESQGALSERFFFGEEDFEFSMRMKQAKKTLACCGSSKIYHKIGVSSKELLEGVEKSVFLFGLNRIVDMKFFYPRIFWEIWRYGVVIYFWALCVVHYKSSLRTASRILTGLIRYTKGIDDVQRATVEKIFKEFKL